MILLQFLENLQKKIFYLIILFQDVSVKLMLCIEEVNN